MIDRGSQVPVKRQAQLLGLSRSSVYYRPRAVSQRDLRLMRRIDELHLKAPFYGARKLAAQLRREGQEVGRRHVATLMRRMGIEALYRHPRTSIPARQATIYPYLLTGVAIERPNQAWSSENARPCALLLGACLNSGYATVGFLCTAARKTRSDHTAKSS
jgi:putative transposase